MDQTTTAISMMKKSLRKNTKAKGAVIEVGSDASIGPFSFYALPFSQMDGLSASLEPADLKELAGKFKLYAGYAEGSYRETIANGTKAIIFAWACGITLNIAKRKLEHGQFGQWLDEELQNTTFRKRTAQRYMTLAKQFSCLDELLAWKPSLRQAYIGCGMLPEPPEVEKPADKDGEATARAGLLKSVASVQNKLRLFSTKKVKLDDGTKKELKSAKAEIDKLFKTLLG